MRAAKLVEDAQSRLSDFATERKRIAEEIEESEELENTTSDANERKVLEKEYLPQLRRNLEEVGVEEHKWQEKEGEAEAQVKVEQTRLDSLNGLLDQLDQALQNTTDTNKPGSLSSLPSHGQDMARK